MIEEKGCASEALDVVLGKGLPVRVGAAGLSMGPDFSAVDALDLQPLEQGDAPRLGDVLLWRQPQGWIAHRAIWKRGGFWLMKGDGNRHCDGWVPEGELRARVTAVHGSGSSQIPRRIQPLLRAWITLIFA